MTAHITAAIYGQDRPGYQQVTICAGPEDKHFMVGRLLMKDAEAAELVARIQAKAHPHTEECALLATKLRVEKKASVKARSNAERAHSKAAMYRRKLEAVRAELHELQGQNVQTEVNFNAYAESAILQENELRAELAAAQKDAAKWLAVEPTIRRAADHGNDPYVELMELAQPTDVTA